MTFITSGALALTLTFHDKIVPVEKAKAVYLIAIGWFFLATTLFINLISHYQSSKSLNRSAEEIDRVISYSLSFENFNNNLNKRNILIDCLNKITIWLLGVGLCFVIMYVTLNIYNGKEIHTQTSVQTTK